MPGSAEPHLMNRYYDFVESALIGASTRSLQNFEFQEFWSSNRAQSVTQQTIYDKISEIKDRLIRGSDTTNQPLLHQRFAFRTFFIFPDISVLQCLRFTPLDNGNRYVLYKNKIPDLIFNKAISVAHFSSSEIPDSFFGRVFNSMSDRFEKTITEGFPDPVGRPSARFEDAITERTRGHYRGMFEYFSEHHGINADTLGNKQFKDRARIYLERACLRPIMFMFKGFFKVEKMFECEPLKLLKETVDICDRRGKVVHSFPWELSSLDMERKDGQVFRLPILFVDSCTSQLYSDICFDPILKKNIRNALVSMIATNTPRCIIIDCSQMFYFELDAIDNEIEVNQKEVRLPLRYKFMDIDTPGLTVTMVIASLIYHGYFLKRDTDFVKDKRIMADAKKLFMRNYHELTFEIKKFSDEIYLDQEIQEHHQRFKRVIFDTKRHGKLNYSGENFDSRKSFQTIRMSYEQYHKTFQITTPLDERGKHGVILRIFDPIRRIIGGQFLDVVDSPRAMFELCQQEYQDTLTAFKEITSYNNTTSDIDAKINIPRVHENGNIVFSTRNRKKFFCGAYIVIEEIKGEIKTPEEMSLASKQLDLMHNLFMVFDGQLELEDIVVQDGKVFFTNFASCFILYAGCLPYMEEDIRKLRKFRKEILGEDENSNISSPLDASPSVI